MLTAAIWSPPGWSPPSASVLGGQCPDPYTTPLGFPHAPRKLSSVDCRCPHAGPPGLEERVSRAVWSGTKVAAPTRLEVEADAPWHAESISLTAASQSNSCTEINNRQRRRSSCRNYDVEKNIQIPLKSHVVLVVECFTRTEWRCHSASF